MVQLAGHCLAVACAVTLDQSLDCVARLKIFGRRTSLPRARQEERIRSFVAVIFGAEEDPDTPCGFHAAGSPRSVGPQFVDNSVEGIN
jgi:hypothetical protein